MDNLIEMINVLRNELKVLGKEAKIFGIHFSDVWENYNVDIHLANHQKNIDFMDKIPADYEYERHNGFIHCVKIKDKIRYTILKCDAEKR